MDNNKAVYEVRAAVAKFITELVPHWPRFANAIEEQHGAGTLHFRFEMSERLRQVTVYMEFAWGEVKVFEAGWGDLPSHGAPLN